MPRTKGQTNSRICNICNHYNASNHRIIERDADDKTRRTYGVPYKMFNFDSYYGVYGPHTCAAVHDDKSGYRNGTYESASSLRTAPITVTDPTPEPIAEPIAEPTVSFTALGDIINAVTEALLEPIKEAAAEAAAAVTPTTHSYTVTSNGAVVNQGTGRPHFKIDRIITSLARRKHVWMAGPAGSGKTTAASMAATMLGLPYFEVSLGPATSQWDLNGFKNAMGEYVPGEMREAYEHGGVMMLDEIDNANPAVLVAINAALANGHGNFPDGRVEKHKDFVCIAGANTFGRGADRMYVGRTQIDAATLDRFKFIPFDYDEAAEFDWAGHDQRNWVQFVQRIRHAAQERGLRVVVSPRASINGADELRDGDDWNTIADEYIWNKMSKEDSDMLKSVCV